MMYFRDLHPTDVIQVFDTPYTLLRVENAYVSVRMENDRLVHYAFDELEPVRLDDFDQLSYIGFKLEKNVDGLYHNGEAYRYKKAFVFPIDNNKIYVEIDGRPVQCMYLHKLQQLYWEVLHENLTFNIVYD